MAKSTPFLSNDPRNPKLFGMLLLLLALYLFIAITSSLFTWQTDFATVQKYTWEILITDISDTEVENWLGRLGALSAYFFVDSMLGLSSYGFVYLLVLYGGGMMNNVPLGRYQQRLTNTVVWMFSLSILFAFLFQKSQFLAGGTFGKVICDWLMGFLGIIGMLLLIIFVMISLVIWTFNPEIQDMTPQKAWQAGVEIFRDFLTGRYRSAALNQQSQRSSYGRAKKTAFEENGENGSSLAPIKAGDKNALEEALENIGGEEESIVVTEEEIPAATETEFTPVQNQKKPSFNALRAGDAELEIEETAAEESSDLEGAVAFNPFPAKGTQGDLFKEGEENGLKYGDLGTPYDPTLDLSHYEFPVLPLLESYDDQKVEIDRAELEANKDQIIETLLNYKIEITSIRATVGPTVTLYEIVPAPGVRISRIKNLEDDIALSLAALGIRIIAPIPGKGTIGIEVPNRNKQMVALREVFANDRYRKTDMELPIALGKTISNEVFVADLAKMPHLLIAGATGQGKSVGINTILMSLLYKKHPAQLKLVLIDPKKVELSPYAKIESHFLAYLPDQLEPIITDTSKVVQTLNSLCIEMDQRYDKLKKAQVRNLKEYNEKFVARKLNPEKGHDYMPFIVLVIDEFADLIMTAGKEVELPIGRLAQLARAVGIHLIIATQRPSVNIITGVIKANFPARLAFKVTSKIDSRTILDGGGADQLIGRGDMLLSTGSTVVRLQCAFVDTPEVERVVDFIAQQPGYPVPFFLPEYDGDGTGGTQGASAFNVNDLDDMIEDAARLVVQNQHGSTSMIQRRLKLGYNRAGRIMDQLEGLGIVGPNEGSKPREVLFHDEQELDRFLRDLRNRG